MTAPDRMTVVYTLHRPQPDLPGRPHHPGRLRGGPGHDRPGQRPTPTPHRCRWAPGPSSTPAGSPTTTSPPPATRTTGGAGSPTWTPITFKPIPDTTQREATLRTGGVDMIESIDPTTITNFSGSGGSGYQLVDSQTGVIGEPTFAFIMLNTVVAPTNDLGIRQALAKGMNQAEVQKIFGGPSGQAGQRPLPARARPTTATPATPPTTRPGPRSWSATYKAQHGTPDLNLLTIPDPHRDQGGPGPPADVAAGRVRRHRHRGRAGHHHRRLRRSASSRRPPPTSSARSTPTSTTCGGAPPPSRPIGQHRPQLRPDSTTRRSRRPC